MSIQTSSFEPINYETFQAGSQRKEEENNEIREEQLTKRELMNLAAIEKRYFTLIRAAFQGFVLNRKEV